MQMHFDAVTHTVWGFWLRPRRCIGGPVTALSKLEPFKLEQLWITPTRTVFFVSQLGHSLGEPRYRKITTLIASAGKAGVKREAMGMSWEFSGEHLVIINTHVTEYIYLECLHFTWVFPIVSMCVNHFLHCLRCCLDVVTDLVTVQATCIVK